MKPMVRAQKVCCIFVLCWGLSLATTATVSWGASMVDYQKNPPFVTAPQPPVAMLILDNSGSMDWSAYDYSSYDSSQTYYGNFKTDKNYSWNNSDEYWYVDSPGSYSGSQLNCYYMRRIDIAKKVLTGGRVITKGGSLCLHSNHSSDQGDVKMEAGDSASGLIQETPSMIWGLAVYDDDSTGDYFSGGGEVKKYINTPTSEIIKAINDLEVTSWTPLAETLYTVAQYFKQDSTCYYQDKRDEESPTFTDSAPVGDGVYSANGEYTKNEEWDPFYDNSLKQLVSCVKPSVIMITDGEATEDEDLPSSVKSAAPFSSGLFGNNGSNYLDDVAYWIHTNDLRPTDLADDQLIDLYTVFAFGSGADDLKDAAVMGGFVDKNGDGNPNNVAQEQAASADMKEWDFDGDGSPDNYAAAADGASLGQSLKDAIGTILDRMSSGGAASVITASRSGEGATYQAIFYPNTPPDSAGRSIKWIGDVHSIWLDDFGNMRADCNAGDTGSSCTTGDHILNSKTDKILEFYTDSATSDAMIRMFNDADGDNHYTREACSLSQYANELDCTSNSGIWSAASSPDYIGTVSMKNFNHYLWSAADWLADASSSQKSSYTATTDARYIFTQHDVGGQPVPVPFTTSAMQTAFPGLKYPGYLGAADATEADKIVNYIRGLDYTNYRSRDYDFGSGVKTYKLGDIINSTPTIVGRPAESYDTIYNDESYRKFRKKYQYRRTMVYAGANDGGLHAFNGGYYDRGSGKFLPAPPKDGIIATPPAVQQYEVEYDLGSEMWMFVPQNLLPHLKWLTDPNYTHVFYADLKPYIFDAKIFEPEAVCETNLNDDGCVHPHGWGTVLVGGMRFGGGDIEIDSTGDGSLDKTMRSAYFLLDVTDPENPPVVLVEYTHPNLGFTSSAPSAIPMLLCDKSLVGGNCPDNSDNAHTWPMNWYLAFGSGPYNPTNIQNAMAGRSTQNAKMFVLSLGGTGGAALSYVSDTTVAGVPANITPPALASGFPKDIVPAADFPKSFFSDLITVDYDLDFISDSLYFGSVSNTDKALSTNYQGGLHRLVVNEDTNPANWNMNTFYNAGQPIVAAPAAAYDGKRAWLYFGTGRLFTAAEDKNDTAQQSFYGLKEVYGADGNMLLTSSNAGVLADVSDIWVQDGTGMFFAVDPTTQVRTDTPVTDVPLTDGGTITASAFGNLNNKMADKDLAKIDMYNGWKLDFPDTGERNLGQAAVLGEIVTFTTFVPSTNICSAEGSSYLWAPFYRTGTAYYKPVIGQRVQTVAGKSTFENKRRGGLGRGMATTPSIHAGGEDGSKAFVQTSTGAIIGIEQSNPGVVKSGITSWREISN